MPPSRHYADWGLIWLQLSSNSMRAGIRGTVRDRLREPAVQQVEASRCLHMARGPRSPAHDGIVLCGRRALSRWTTRIGILLSRVRRQELRWYGCPMTMPMICGITRIHESLERYAFSRRVARTLVPCSSNGRRREVGGRCHTPTGGLTDCGLLPRTGW